MTQGLEARVARIEKQLLFTRVVAVAFAVGLVIALVTLTRPSPAPQTLELSGPLGTSRLLPEALELGETRLEQEGLTVISNTGSEVVSAQMKTNRRGAFSAIGIENLGISQSVKAGNPIVSVTFAGRVDSELQVNTETGEWTVVRSAGEGSEERRETTTLITPFKPQ